MKRRTNQGRHLWELAGRPADKPTYISESDRNKRPAEDKDRTWALPQLPDHWIVEHDGALEDAPAPEVRVLLQADARNHTDAPCPECASKLRDASAGSVPGAVVCDACGWSGEWIRTVGEIVGQEGPSAVFLRPSPGDRAITDEMRAMSRPTGG